MRKKWWISHPENRLSGFHYPKKCEDEPSDSPSNIKLDARRMCMYCSSKTRYMCGTCEAYLCISTSDDIGCFGKFHSEESW